MRNLTTSYFGTLLFAGMALTVALCWMLSLFIQRSRTQKPDIPDDFSQVKVFGGLCLCITLVLLAKGV